MSSDPDISFVCCIEAGVLESQTERLVRSLRRYGGRFAKAPVFAVTPRHGPRLSSRTLSMFEECGVQYIKGIPHPKYEWFNFLNKPLALIAAEAHIKTETAAWIDGDLLFLDEPSELGLAPSEDFAGFPVETKEMGTAGPGDPYESLWQSAGRHLGVSLEDLPYITTAQTRERIRLYFNGGIFTYRRSSGFAQSYLDICIELLDSKISTTASGYNLGFKEMSAIGFAVIKGKLNWRALPYSHDYVMLSTTHDDWYNDQSLREAKIVHYHDAMWPHFWPTFHQCLARTHPEAAKWLEVFGPMRNEADLISRMRTRWLKRGRVKKADAYASSCISV